MLLNNLLDNTIKYTPKSRQVTVEVFENNQGKHLLVADQGPGIPDAEKQQIFEKFYRMGDEKTRSAKGTGLGLYLCKKIARDHKGTIHVTDNDPEGSVFNVIFR